MWSPALCPLRSHLDALHCLVDGLEQSPVLGVLVAVFIGKHVGEGFYVAVEVLLRHWLLLNTTIKKFLKKSISDYK